MRTDGDRDAFAADLVDRLKCSGISPKNLKEFGMTVRWLLETDDWERTVDGRRMKPSAALLKWFAEDNK